MAGAIFKRLRSIITVCVGLSLLPFAIVTLVLLFCTGKPIPNQTRSFRELGFRPGFPFNTTSIPDDDTETPGVIFSHDDRFFARGNPVHDELKPSALIDAQIFDTATLENLGAFPGELEFFGFDVSPDRTHLAFVGSTEQVPGILTIGDLRTGKTERFDVKTILFSPRCFFSPNGRELMILSLMGSPPIHYDLKARRIISTLPCVPDRHDILAFFDNRGRAKVLAKDSGYVIWDVDSNKIDATLDLSELAAAGSFDPLNTEVGAYVGHAADLIAIAHDDCGIVSVNSIQDGRTIRLCRIPPNGQHHLSLTPDGRYLMCQYVNGSSWLSTLEFCLREFCSFVPDPRRLVLIDLQSSKTWSGIPGFDYFVFSDDAKKLAAFTDESRIEYDIPPSWRYCDPLAWVALGVWVSLLVCWLKLRGGLRRSPV